MQYFLKLYYKIILWSLVIAYLCFAPADEFKNVHITIPHFDKVVHFGMFYILALFIAGKRDKVNTSLAMVILPVMAIAYGGIIEIIQWQFIPMRDGDIIDWGADILGVLLGLISIRMVPRKLYFLIQ